MKEKEITYKIIEIINDIENKNIKGYIELKDYYLDNNEKAKLQLLSLNHTFFYHYIISRNHALKQKFNIYEYEKKKRNI